jgi:forkhead box protein K
MASISPAPIDSTPRAQEITEPTSDKISAYYSLVFPNITYYLQTLSVTIGRRCLPNINLAATSLSESQQIQVDVDLGPLKSVSRLHAKIEWQEEEERFVLSVIGRNGAWVDGVWSGNGSKVGLGERCVISACATCQPKRSFPLRSSQIQIASRTFHFVLPPPPQPPEDSPSPSSQSSGPTLIDATMSGTRARSLSVDITSLSPPTSEHTPPPLRKPKDPPPSPKDHKPAPSAGKRKPAPANKKRKKAPQRPPTPPEVMPPKPTFTYAQLCYRAIKSLDGKATLQDICGWMMETFDWYRYNEGSGWEVRLY